LAGVRGMLTGGVAQEAHPALESRRVHDGGAFLHGGAEMELGEVGRASAGGLRERPDGRGEPKGSAKMYWEGLKIAS
jgi:hypothetical protein